MIVSWSRAHRVAVAMLIVTIEAIGFEIVARCLATPSNQLALVHNMRWRCDGKCDGQLCVTSGSVRNTCTFRSANYHSRRCMITSSSFLLLPDWVTVHNHFLL